MKVLLLNGSPHEKGCVFTALNEVAKEIAAAGIGTKIFWIGNRPVRDCIACGGCSKPGAAGCVFQDDVCTEFVEKMRSADGLIVGSPVYYAGPSGSLCSLLDRAFYSAKSVFSGKPAACIVNCRRGGASAAFDRLNKYFTICQMPVVSSQYWNDTHGRTPDEVLQDAEGVQTMRVLGKNMAYLLRCQAKAELPFPAQERKIATNFIR